VCLFVCGTKTDIKVEVDVTLYIEGKWSKQVNKFVFKWDTKASGTAHM